MRVRVDSIGCRLNIGEMDELARSFASRGHRIVGPGDAADLFVFNTCAVTHVASRKSRKILRQIRRHNPAAKVIATGCYAELAPAEVQALGVDGVVSNADKDRLIEILEQDGLLLDADPVPEPGQSACAALPAGRTRAFVKVQDGCDNRCTFCIVTVARGEGRSRPMSEIIDQIRQLDTMGYQEVVLSGVHLGSYGHDRGNRDGLHELVRCVLARTRVPRLRLSSLEPWDLGPGFFDLWRDSRLQPHLHLPLQSGCDATLLRMARRTSRASFSRLLQTAREAIPEVAISTDVIVGFPAETDSEFEESIDFVAAAEFARLHVFRYSPREGTAAVSMAHRVPESVARDRSRRMHALGADLERSYQERYLGRVCDVLWESHEPYGDGNRWAGLTGNYLRVITDTPGHVDLRNHVLQTVLLARQPGALYGSTALSVPALSGIGHPMEHALRPTAERTHHEIV